MSNDIVKTDLELKVERAKDGYARLEGGMAPFAFPERSLVREEVIGRFQKGLDLFTEVRRTRAAYELAVEEHQRAVPGLKQFHREAIQVARHHFGADAKRMATFEARSPSRSHRRRGGCQEGGEGEVTTAVVEELVVVGQEPGCEGSKPPCEARKPKPGCRHRQPPAQGKRIPGRGGKKDCEAQKGCGSPVKQRCR